MDMDIDTLEIIDQRLNWELPQLAEFKHRKASGDDLETIILDFVSYLRERNSPNMGYSKAYIADVKERANAEAVSAAQERWEELFGTRLDASTHHNCFSLLGAESIFIAATPELCQKTAEEILNFKSHWSKAGGAFGPTLSLCKLLSYLFPLEACSNDDILPILGWLLIQSEKEWERGRNWSERNLGNSGHNWFAHCYYGMWLTHLFFPEFKQFNKFSALFPNYLERELNLLFYSDGWSKEGAVGYHYHGALMCQEFAYFAELNGHTLPDRIQQRLKEISRCQFHLICPDGQFPAFHDSCRRIGQIDYASTEYHSGRPDSFYTYLRMLIAKYDLAEEKYKLMELEPHWQPAWHELIPFLGKNYFQAYQAVRTTPPASCDDVLPEGGYYVMRDTFQSDSNYLAINAGIVGPIVTSHKHVDIFDLNLFSHGRQILADNWYGDCAEMEDEPMVRRWRVGSSAHNVSTVDNEDHVEIQQVYRYAFPVLPLIDDWRSEKDYAYFSGSHEGYQRLEHPVSCVGRKVFYLRNRYWIITDRFVPADDARHDYQLHFQLKAESEIGKQKRAVTSGKGGNLAIVPVNPESLEVNCTANPYPVKGYENPDHLRYEAKNMQRCTLCTLLVPFLDDDVPEIEVRDLDLHCDDRILSKNEATALQIRVGQQQDLYVNIHTQWSLEWLLAGHRSDARVWHSSFCSK